MTHYRERGPYRKFYSYISPYYTYLDEYYSQPPVFVTSDYIPLRNRGRFVQIPVGRNQFVRNRHHHDYGLVRLF